MDILHLHSLRESRWQAAPRAGLRDVLAVLAAVGLFVWAVLRVI